MSAAKHSTTITPNNAHPRACFFPVTVGVGLGFVCVYYGCPAQQMRTLYFHPVVSSSVFFFPRLFSAVAD